ncbi:MAG TPA: S8 family serine peptidase [Streptosporangiaceae bacterium]
MHFRFRLAALIAAAGLLPLGLSGPAAAAHSPARVLRGERPVLTAAQVSRLAAHATDRSIIIFKNQLSSLPVRGASAQLRVNAAKAAQAPVLAELTRLHAAHVQGFHIINAIAATISPAETQRLRANPAVRAVVPDSLQRLAPLTRMLTPLGHGKSGHSSATAGHSGAAPANAVTDLAQRVCPANPAHPLVEPEARSLMNVDAAQKIVTGKGIKVAVLADGIDPSNPDLIRPNGQHVIFDYQDFSGQGPTAPGPAVDAFLNAGLIAGQGNVVYDLSKFVNPAHPLPAGCNIKLEGISPGVSMSELNWGGNDAAVFNSQIIQTIQYAVMVDHANVIDEPFGGTAVPNFQNDPPTLANQAAVAAGVVVVSSTGDNGDTVSDIDSPGGTPGVIGVGSSTAFQGYLQTGVNGPNLASGGGWEDNNISSVSTSGINEFDPRTLDVVAPGDITDALCSTNLTEFFGCTDTGNNNTAPGIVQVGSTAAAAGEVAGVAALVMQAYAKTHHGVMPPAPLVERIIMSTATDLGAPADHQGAGMVNALKAVQLAESINSASPQGSTLLANKTGLNATVNAGQSHTFSIGITNEGSAPKTVTPKASGNPTLVSRDAGSVTLSSSSPTTVDGSGFTDSYETHTFTLPAGTGYLNGNITWDSQLAGGAVIEELFDPHGNLAALSELGVLQSGFGHVEVSHPMAGTWTAVIYTINVEQFFGPVRFAYTTENFHTAGSVSPASRTLAPGQSGTFHVTVTAGQAGDQALSLHLGTGSSTDGVIPIVLRALVPVSSAGGSFKGTVSGDNTPGFSTAGGGQELTYQFEVPAGEPSLNVSINLRHPDVLEGAIISPFDESLDLQSTANNANAPGTALQFFRRTPVPGLWTVSVITFAPLDGKHLRVPFTGAISFTAPTVTSSGLPDSAGTVLPAGQPVTATVSVTNTGNIAKDYFADPRLNHLAPLQLLGTNVPGGTSYTQPQVSVPEPMPVTVNPHFLIPTDTRTLIGVAHGTTPLSFDMNADDNDPEEQGVSFGDYSVATHSEPELSLGQEWNAPEPLCPCSGPITGTSKLVAVAIANPFDSAVSSSTGDAWAQTVSVGAPYTPLTLAPGQSGTITLTITPGAAKGTVVRGFIAVDTYNQATSSGDELINIPYTYKVG